MLGRKNELAIPFTERKLPQSDSVEMIGAKRVSEIVGAAAQAGNVVIMPVAAQLPEQHTDDLPPAS